MGLAFDRRQRPHLAHALDRLDHQLDSGDIAMVKGSRGARVELVVEAIKRMGEVRPLTTIEG